MYFVLRAFKHFITLLITHIAVSGDDTLKIWDIRNFKRFLNLITHIAVSGDDTLKIWDIRNFKRFLNIAMNLPSYFPQ